MESHALYPPDRHIVTGAEQSAELGERFSPFGADIDPVTVVPGVVTAPPVVELPANPLLLHVFDTGPEGEVVAQVVPPVHEAVLSYVRFIAESVAVMVACA